MTYCVAIAVEQGLVFASDSRTNAGPDQVSVFGKMHVLLEERDRFFVLLSAGNLATTQAVRTRIRHDLEFDRRPNLKTVQSMAETAEYLGEINAEQRRKYVEAGESDAVMTATFILGGQIAGRPAGIMMIYPEGNYIRASSQTPFLQIGESKYGKPILDRLVRPEFSLEDTARVALLSMDATMRSNVTVGPPIEVLIFDERKPGQLRHMVFGPDDDYLRELGRGWQSHVEKAFSVLPPLPPRPAELLRVVDE
ncbi:MAG: peptidase [Gammaproteobacteria bacterium]